MVKLKYQQVGKTSCWPSFEGGQKLNQVLLFLVATLLVLNGSTGKLQADEDNLSYSSVYSSTLIGSAWGLPSFYFDRFRYTRKIGKMGAFPAFYFGEFSLPTRFGNNRIGSEHQILSLAHSQTTVVPRERWGGGVYLPFFFCFNAGLIATKSQGEHYEIQYDDREREIFRHTYKGPLSIQVDTSPMLLFGYMMELHYDLGRFQFSFGSSRTVGSPKKIQLRSIEGLDLADEDREYLEYNIAKVQVNHYEDLWLRAGVTF